MSRPDKGNSISSGLSSHTANPISSPGRTAGRTAGVIPVEECEYGLKNSALHLKNGKYSSIYTAPSPEFTKCMTRSGFGVLGALKRPRSFSGLIRIVPSSTKCAFGRRIHVQKNENTPPDREISAAISEAIAAIHAASLSQLMDLTVHGDMRISDRSV